MVATAPELLITKKLAGLVSHWLKAFVWFKGLFSLMHIVYTYSAHKKYKTNTDYLSGTATNSNFNTDQQKYYVMMQE